MLHLWQYIWSFNIMKTNYLTGADTQYRSDMLSRILGCMLIHQKIVEKFRCPDLLTREMSAPIQSHTIFNVGCEFEQDNCSIKEECINCGKLCNIYVLSNSSN